MDFVRRSLRLIEGDVPVPADQARPGRSPQRASCRAVPWNALAICCGLAFTAKTARAQLCHDLPDLESHHHAGKASASKPEEGGAGEPAAHGADGDGGHAGHGGHGGHGDQGLGVALGLRLEAATAAIQRRPIDYQGTTLRVDLHLRRFHLRAQGSWYRLRDSIEHTTGPGDVMVAAMWTAYQGERLHAGVALPVGLPTGDDEERLGMGHVMIMPGVFAALRATPEITISAGIAYNRALESGEGHNHGIGPYVNPMTKEELGGAARISVRTSAMLQLVGETAIAAPLDGQARMIVGGGFALQRERMTISVLAQAGALYEPFTARGVADLAYAF